jgi:hypothetical protein
MEDPDPLGTGYDNQGKRPWFGPKLYGMGFRPQTWQGYLITAALVLPVVIVAVVTNHHHSPLILLAAIPAVLIPLIIMMVQRR